MYRVDDGKPLTVLSKVLVTQLMTQRAGTRSLAVEIYALSEETMIHTHIVEELHSVMPLNAFITRNCKLTYTLTNQSSQLEKAPLPTEVPNDRHAKGLL